MYCMVIYWIYCRVSGKAWDVLSWVRADAWRISIIRTSEKEKIWPIKKKFTVVEKHMGYVVSAYYEEKGFLGFSWDILGEKGIGEKILENQINLSLIW